MERLYGIKHGNNQHERTSNNYKSSQEELASQLGISVPTLQNYKLLTEMIPELERIYGIREGRPKNYEIISSFQNVARRNNSAGATYQNQIIRT